MRRSARAKRVVVMSGYSEIVQSFWMKRNLQVTWAGWETPTWR